MMNRPRSTVLFAMILALPMAAVSHASALKTRVCVTNKIFLKGDQGSLNIILVDQKARGVVTGGKQVEGYDSENNCKKAIFPGTTCEFEVKNRECFAPPGNPPECGPGHILAFGTDSMTINGPTGSNPIICDHNYDANADAGGAGAILGTLRVTVGDPPDGDGTNTKGGAHCKWEISSDTDC